MKNVFLYLISFKAPAKNPSENVLSYYTVFCICLLTILSNLSIEVNNVYTLFIGDASQTVLQTTQQTAFIVIVALEVYSRHTKH